MKRLEALITPWLGCAGGRIRNLAYDGSCVRDCADSHPGRLLLLLREVHRVRHRAGPAASGHCVEYIMTERRSHRPHDDGSMMMVAVLEQADVAHIIQNAHFVAQVAYSMAGSGFIVSTTLAFRCH